MSSPRSAAPVYLALAVLGTLWPLSQIVPWLMVHGFNLGLFWQSIVGSGVSAFAWADVVVTVLTIIAFAWHERRKIPGWGWAVLASLTVGASLGLPLLLYLREKAAYSST